MPFDPDDDRLIFLDARRALRIKDLTAAQDARDAGKTMQRGEARVGDGDADAALLEVICYEAGGRRTR